MAISWITKQRIRLNPNIICNLPADRITNEIIDFAMLQPRISLLKCLEAFSKNEHFIENFIKTDAFISSGAAKLRVFTNMHKYTQGLRDKIIECIIENKIEISLYMFDKKYLEQEPRILKYYFSSIKDPDSPFLDLNLSNYSFKDIEDIIDILIEHHIDYSYFPNIILKDKRCIPILLDKDFPGVISTLSGRYASNNDYIDEVKKYFLSNLEKTISHYYRVELNLSGYLDFNDAEKEKLLQFARTPSFVFNSNSRFFNSIFLADRDVNFNIFIQAKNYGDYSSINFKHNFTKEQKEIMVNVLLQKSTKDFVKQNITIFRSLIKNQIDIIIDLINKNYYILDYLSEANVDLPNSVLDKFKPKEGQYLPNEFSKPKNITINPSAFLKYLSTHFDEVINSQNLADLSFIGPRISIGHPSFIGSPEIQKSIYEIALEHNFKLDAISPPFLSNNPYIYRDRVQRGILPEYHSQWSAENIPFFRQTVKHDLETSGNTISQTYTDEEIINYLIIHNYLIGNTFPIPLFNGKEKEIVNTPEFIFRSLQKNIMSAINFNTYAYGIENLSDADLKRIAYIYEQTDKSQYPERVLDMIENSPLFEHNPYIQHHSSKSGGQLPLQYILSTALVLHYVEKDITNIYGINPNLNMNNFSGKELIKIAQREKIVLRAYSHVAFRSDKQIILSSIEKEPQSIEYAIQTEPFNISEQNKILDCLLNSNTPILLNKFSFDFLRTDVNYILYSLEHANEANIKGVIEGINFNIRFTRKEEILQKIISIVKNTDLKISQLNNNGLITEIFKNIDNYSFLLENDFELLKHVSIEVLSFSKETQKTIFDAYKKNEIKYSKDSEIQELMLKNSFYVMELISQNPEIITEIDFGGLQISDDIKSKIKDYYLDNRIMVTDKTPRFLKDDLDFVYNYIMNNDGELNGLSLNDVAPLLEFSQIHAHPEYLNLSKYYDVIDIGYKPYFLKWGKEKTLQMAQQLGNLVRFIDINEDISLEDLSNKISVLLFNRNNFSDNEVIEILSILDINIPADFFEIHENLCKSDKLFNILIEKNSNYIKYYDGNSEEIFNKALHLNIDLNPALLQKENFANSTVLFEYILQNNIVLFSFYKGNDESLIKKAISEGYFDDQTIEELNGILSNNYYYKSNPLLFNYLIDTYGIQVGEMYCGYDSEIFDKLIKSGMFHNKPENEVIDFLKKKPNFASYSALFDYLLDNYSPQVVIEYRGSDINIFYKAINNGLIIDSTFFDLRADLINNEELVKCAAKNDKYCSGLLISKLADDVDLNREKILEIVKSVLGNDQYLAIFSSKEIENEILNLCTLSDSPKAGINLMKCLNYEFMSGLGFNGWKNLIKYTFNNPNFSSLLNIISKNESKKFLYVSKTLWKVYYDNKANGINKFMNFAALYDKNPDFLLTLAKNVQNGKQLSSEEILDLYIILNSENTEQRHFSVENLGNYTEIERNTRMQKMKSGTTPEQIKKDLISFLFNINDAKDFLEHNIDTQTIIRIMNRAKKDGKLELTLASEYLMVLVDILEQLQYGDLSLQQITKIAQNVYSQDIKVLAQIRKDFCRIDELVRYYYEMEAKQELTNIQSLINNPTFASKDGNDLIIDLSQSRHTLYAHVLTTSMSKFFNTDRGKVTICVSPITDQHEAYYNDDCVILGFDSIPTGSFIGSAPSNMGSNGSISSNNYDDAMVKKLFKQTGIRESYKDTGAQESGHSETLLYRLGLVPSCIIMRGAEPTEEEKNAREELEKIINAGIEPNNPRYRVIPLVKTQRAQNRVFDYEKKLPEKITKTEPPTKQEERIDELRKKFSNLLDFNSTSAVQRKNKRNEEYIIDANNVYILKPFLSEREEGAMKAGAALQQIVHGKTADYILKIKNFTIIRNGRKTTCIGIRDTDARSMWRFNRQDPTLSHASNSILLKEFLVDHLLINYGTDNTSYLLDSDEKIYGTDKTKAASAISDFTNSSDEIYTQMSYLYFDSHEGNNLYRKIFESYIKASDKDKIFTDTDLVEFIQISDRISSMDDRQYLQMFNDMLKNIPNVSERSKVKKHLLARKNNVGKDSREFVERLEKLRQIEQNPEIIENPNSVAIINDIHGNAEALKALFNECKKAGKKDIFVLGDMIGFGPQSNECIDIIRENSKYFNIRCILGNHELYSLMGNKSFLTDTAGFQPEMTTQIRNRLSAENRSFIESLPITRKVIIGEKKIEFTHFPISNSFEQDSKMYIGHGRSAQDFNSSINGINQDAVIYGHEHRTEYTKGDDIGTVDTLMINDTLFINLPSSGCVHGRNTSFATLHITSDTIELEANAVPYQREKLEQVLKSSQNKNAHFFGGIQDSRS